MYILTKSLNSSIPIKEVGFKLVETGSMVVESRVDYIFGDLNRGGWV